MPTLLCSTSRQSGEAGIRYDIPSSRGQGAQALGTPGSAVSGCTFLPVPRSERIGPWGFRNVQPAGGRSIRRAGLPEGRGYPASTRKGRWSRALGQVSVGRQTSACTPLARYRRSGVCVVSLPTLVGAPTVPLREEGVGTERSLVFCRSFAMEGLLRLGGGGVGAPASGCRRGAGGKAREGLERAPLGSLLRARSWSASGHASWWTRGPRGRAPLGRCARGAGKAGPRSRCAPLWPPAKKEQGTVTAHKWAPQESWNPNQGAQTWEGSSEGHLSYTRGHHCVHSSHSRLNCEEVAAPPHFQYPKWFENVHRLVTDGFFFFLSLLMVG